MITRRYELAGKVIELRSELDEKLSRFEREKSSIRTSYSESGKEESERILEEARAQSVRIREDAEVSFELHSEVKRREFEREIRDKAIDRAREEIKSKLLADASLRDRLIEQSISSLEI